MGTLITEHRPSPAADGARRQIDTEHDSLDERVTEMVVETGSGFELFSGVLAIVLAVLGLAGYHPELLAAGATIAVGFALIAQGGAIASRWRRAVHLARTERAERLGLTTEMFGGLALIVLGVLALLGVAPVMLLGAAACVAGATLLLGGPTQPDFTQVPSGASPVRWQVIRRPSRGPLGAMVMAGLAALVLGIIALLGRGPSMSLVLVAMLCTAAALVLAGGSVMSRLVQREPEAARAA